MTWLLIGIGSGFLVGLFVAGLAAAASSLSPARVVGVSWSEAEPDELVEAVKDRDHRLWLLAEPMVLREGESIHLDAAAGKAVAITEDGVQESELVEVIDPDDWSWE